MTSVRARVRPYTSPLIKNPTYPTVVNGCAIRELAWEEEVAPQPSIIEVAKAIEQFVWSGAAGSMKVHLKTLFPAMTKETLEAVIKLITFRS